MVGEAPFGNVVFVKWCDVCAVYVCACVSVCVCMALHVRTWRLFDSVYGCCVCVYECCVCVCVCVVCVAPFAKVAMCCMQTRSLRGQI